MVASDADDCEEDDSFISDQWASLDSKSAGKFIPGGKVNNQAEFKEFFNDLATTQNSNALAGKIDAFFNEHFRKEEANNVFVPDSKTQAYKTFTEGAVVGNTKRFPTQQEVLDNKKYQICQKLNNKDCPAENIAFADAIEIDSVPQNTRRRRSVPRRVRRSNKNAAIPKDKFFITGEMFVYLMDQFEPKLTGFAEWAENNYQPGYSCLLTPLSKPGGTEGFLQLHNSDIRGRFCKPQVEPTSCKVPEHEGPIGNGFHIKSSSAAAERAPGFVTTELKIKGFSKFTKFAECMKKVMLEIEGIAHMPELDEKLKHYAGAEDRALWRDQVKDENYQLDGHRNGLNPRSLSSKASNVRNLPDNHEYMASEPAGQKRQYLHGGGSRYIQQNNDEYYTDACKQFLDDEDLPDAYDVPGSSVPGSQTKTYTVNSVKNENHAGDGPGSLDYDMDASLMGYQPLEKLKRSDGLCVMAPRWLPQREADYIKYGLIQC